jgi:hypothetical protein
MSYLNRMYSRKASPSLPTASDKNPNRVTGGLRGQGVDTLTMVSEDGSSRELPTLEYVRSLEEQSRKQRAAITTLERKANKQETAIQQLTSAVMQRR